MTWSDELRRDGRMEGTCFALHGVSVKDRHAPHPFSAEAEDL